ncbi:unnamed protein product [Caenorhabditis angaria]|uniref:Major sperm protein n=1 Tax=Caenorhabditis angaria TaxID=860376 RepID=A0A9P1IFT9_9PELO|nr:unnamed protein product [Caenorhabditis angaria]
MAFLATTTTASNNNTNQIGKRHRNDYDYGGGDQNLLMMVERETVAGGSTMQRDSVKCGGAEKQEEKLGGLIGSSEATILALVSLAIYLINGEYAHTICTTITSVPPAIFSYRVLVNTATSKEGYHSILFYWTLYGIFALIDQIVANAHGYNLCKGGLLGTVFLHSLRTNQCSIPKSWQKLSIFARQFQAINPTILTQFDSQGFVKRTGSSNFVPRSPTQTEFSDESQFMEEFGQETGNPEENVFEELSELDFDYVDEIEDLSTACSFQPSIQMQSTQKLSPEIPLKFASMSALTITASATNRDIITVPAERLEFSRKLRETVISVTNVSPLHLMFSLKTNADTYLIAAPTTGFIKSGQTIKIRVGVTDDYFSANPIPGKSIDKLAIDYSTIPQNLESIGIQEFDQNVFQNSIRRRNAIRVFYK